MLKWIKIIFGLLVLVVVAVVIFISTVDANRYKSTITNAIEEGTGRQLQINGNLQFAASLIPTIIVEDAKLSNASWGSKPEMISLDKFEVQVSLIPLFHKELQINRFILLKPTILLETNKEGLGNWVIESKNEVEETTESNFVFPAIVFNKIEIRDADLIYKDGITGQETNISVEEFSSLSADTNDAISFLLKMAYNTTPIEIEGSLGSINQLLANTSFPVDLAINANSTTAKIKGSISQPLDGKGLDLAFNFDTPALSQLAAFSPKELPEVSAISLNGTVSNVVTVALKAIYKETPIELNGTFGSLDQLMENELFPVDLAINANKAIANIKGSIANPLDAKGLDVVVNFDADSLSQLAAFSPNKLPDVSAISLSTTINDSFSIMLKAVYNETPLELKGTLGSIDQLMANENYPVDVVIIANETKAALKGMIAKPMDAKGLDLAINFNAKSLSQLSKLAQTKLPELGPVDLSAKVTEENKVYSLAGMTLALGKTDLAGSLSANLAGEIPDIKAKLTSNLIDIAELTGDGQETEKPKKTDSKARLFSSDPLPLESLKSVNANVTIDAKKIITSSMTFEKTQLVLDLQDGNLAIKPLDTHVAGGNINATLHLKNSGKTANLTAEINAKGIEPSQIGDLKEQLSGAKTDATINVKGSGISISEIMAGLNGQIIVKSDEGSIKSSAGNTLGNDIFSSLNPFSKSSDETKLQCAAVKFDIKDGLAKSSNGIAISMEKMNIIGSGTIDLKTEKLNITIDPQSREGVGLNAGKLASVVKLGGTLANPKPIADAAGTLTTGLSVGTAVATGGVSLLVEGLFDRVTADADPCAVALGIKPKPSAKKQATPAEAVKDTSNVKSAPTKTNVKQETLPQ